MHDEQPRSFPSVVARWHGFEPDWSKCHGSHGSHHLTADIGGPVYALERSPVSVSNPWDPFTRSRSRPSPSAADFA
jgi:hypothetical protein